MKVTFWKFVAHQVQMTRDDAAQVAKQIETGAIVPHNQCGERYYKIGGWCFDIGRRAFLVQFSHGAIERAWARSVTELRKAMHLSRKDRVAADPFYKEVFA